MTEILTAFLVLLALVAGLVALVLFASRDAFAGPGIGHQHLDELGPLGFRRRPA
ncbi:hypothetical protein [Nocardioides pocheonensis]|jgi:hypothetical protein|uniref:hypothetical protein n=1 Tax=Nocardioides pocheonensis TaxID=661485 RepID=UPI0016186D6A|nr:hypothetical protein [Nocardioides pocheonensis]